MTFSSLLLCTASLLDAGIRTLEAGSTQLTIHRKPKEVLQRGTGHLSVFAAVSVSGIAMPSLVSSATWGQLLLVLTQPGERHVSAVIGNCATCSKSQLAGLGQKEMLSACWWETAGFNHICGVFSLFLPSKFYQSWFFSLLMSAIS